MFVPICDWFKTITPGYIHTSLLVSTCSVKVASNMLRIISALFETSETERPSSTSETDGDTVTKGPAMKVLLTWGCSLSRNVLQHRWDHHYRWKRIIPRPCQTGRTVFFSSIEYGDAVNRNTAEAWSIVILSELLFPFCSSARRLWLGSSNDTRLSSMICYTICFLLCNPSPPSILLKMGWPWTARIGNAMWGLNPSI